MLAASGGRHSVCTHQTRVAQLSSTTELRPSIDPKSMYVFEKGAPPLPLPSMALYFAGEAGGRGNIWRLATVGAACRAEQPTPLRCFLCVLREQCPLMGRAEFHRQMVLRCLDCYCSESTALNTQISIGDIGSKANILNNRF